MTASMTPGAATPTDLAALKARLLHARTSLVDALPFLGSLVLRLPVRIAEALPWGTACIDTAGTVSFDRAFLAALSQAELRNILLHETLHLALDVFGRRGSRLPLRWNVAHDHAVNWLIEQSAADAGLPRGFLAWPKTFPPLMDPAYRGLSAEEIYDRLPASFEAGLSRDLDFEGSEASLRELRERWRANLVGAAEELLRHGGFGDLPAWAQRLLGPLLRPELPWQTLLAQKVHGHLAGRRRTFHRPGRRSAAVGALLPGAQPDTGLAGVFVDVSGSVDPATLQAFLGELGGILQDAGVPVRLLTWDVEVTGDWRLEAGEPLIRWLQDVGDRLLGGGGTDPRCVIAHLEDGAQAEQDLPSFGVLLTDGWVPWPEPADWPFPVLVVTTQEPPPVALGYDALALPMPGAQP